MAMYLNEGQCGCDGAKLGFPHLLLCMGVVLQTDADLYGCHLDIPTDTDGYAEGLLTYMREMGDDIANGVRLYGCCNRQVRYGSNEDGSTGKAGWKAEMRQIARILKYKGPVSGFDTAMIAPADGTYVEFERVLGKSKAVIRYKRNERMAFTNAASGNAIMGLKTWDPANNKWKNSKYQHATDSAALDTKANTLHELNYFLNADSFTI